MLNSEWLIDMDNVIAAFNEGWRVKWQDKHPEIVVPPSELTQFYIKDNYPQELLPEIEAIYNEPGFYLTLPLVEGAIVALDKIAREVKHPRICTSPLLTNLTCTEDKIKWVQANLGSFWTKRLIFERDKTKIAGKILIDDNPNIKGGQKPSWEHILFDMPCNKGIPKRRITWSNWQTLLD